MLNLAQLLNLSQSYSFATRCIASVALLAACNIAAAQTVSPVSARTQPRTFARGVVTTILPQLEAEETTSVHDMIEITANKQLEWTPKLSPKSDTLYSKAQSARFSHEVWGLEFSFKPLRMIEVDLPEGRKRIWYLVYNVKNNGDRLKPVADEGGDFTAEAAEPQPVEFLPHFVLEGQDVNAAGKKNYKAYLDRILPSAVEVIRRREVPGRQLLHSAQMAETPIAVSGYGDNAVEGRGDVWGVAMWEDVDPEMDFFSVFVGGLTNANVWADTPGAYKSGDAAGKGRRIASKVLQLNFWRPGDEFLESEREIRYGVPTGKASLYGVEEGVAYQWTFR